MFNRLFYTDEMTQFLELSSKKSIIGRILLSGDNRHITEEGNFIRRNKSEIDVISYLPKSKYEKVDSVWDSKSRVNIKIGRFVRKFINNFSIESYEITDVQIEKFVNLYKSYFSNDKNRLEVVSGKDIMKYYLHTNYHTMEGCAYGTLWNSCMRQSERNSFLELYTKSDDIKMLVLLSEKNKVIARALLWDNVFDHNGEKKYKFMDRIYTFYDHDVNLFKKWANENGYITKWEQNAKSESTFDISGLVINLSLYVKIPNLDVNYFPYLDTFKYYNVFEDRFSNSSYYDYDYKLTHSNGRLEGINNELGDEGPLMDFDDSDTDE